MQIVPVIDLKKGQVVHAHRGKRDQYKPIHSKLCPDSNPLSVIDRFLSLHPFKVFYIADLDAIQQQGDQNLIITQILHHYPQKIFWVDQGIIDPATNEKHSKSKITVIGSESVDKKTWPTLNHLNKPFILSLDFYCKDQLGFPRLFDISEFWPQNIIIMTLNRVGSEQGPDLHQLQHYQQRYPEKNFIAAGGIRNQDDILALKNIGIKTALIATAIHQGSLNKRAIDKICI